MTQEQVTSLARQLLLLIGGGLITRGWVDEGTWQLIVGAILAVGTAGWAIYMRRPAGLIAAAAARPEVSGIVAPTLAHDIPSPKVVATPLSLAPDTAK